MQARTELRSTHGSARARLRLTALLMMAVAAVFSLALAPSAMARTHNHGAASGASSSEAVSVAQAPATGAEAAGTPSAEQAGQASGQQATPTVSYHAPTVFTLRTGIAGGRMVYLGVGGDIDGQVNPTLMVHEGELVQINLINGEGAEHDVVVDQYAARSAIVVGKNASSTFSFTASKVGEFAYFCSIPGHRAAGMAGMFHIMAGPPSVRRPPLGTIPPICLDRSASALRRWCASTWKRWS